MKPSEIPTLVLETLLEVERAKAEKVLDIPAFLPKISDEALLRAAGTGPAKPKLNPFKVAVPPPGVLPPDMAAPR